MCQTCRDYFDSEIAHINQGDVLVKKEPKIVRDEVDQVYGTPEAVGQFNKVEHEATPEAMQEAADQLVAAAKRDLYIRGLYKQGFGVAEVDGVFVVHKQGQPLSVTGATYAEAWDALIAKRFSRG